MLLIYDSGKSLLGDKERTYLHKRETIHCHLRNGYDDRIFLLSCISDQHIKTMNYLESNNQYPSKVRFYYFCGYN